MSQAYPYGSPRASGLIKHRAEDFIVTEELGFEPDGAGEHLFLWIEKSALSTPELVAKIAAASGLESRHVGYSGLKDKHALTCQWLSLHLPGRPDPVNLVDGEGYRILQRRRHSSKLRPGTHKRNHFDVRVREVENFDAQSHAQMRQVGDHGIANYFGRQRFGRQGDNVEQALRQLGRRKMPRQRKSLLVSALRSFLFNQVLERRIARHGLEQPVAGDVFMLDGSHSIFSATLDDDLERRYRSLDIHPSASLYGQGESMLQGDALALEQEVFAEYPEIVKCLDGIGVKRRMRALRVRPVALEYRHDETGRILQLRLSLPAGSYLTSLLDHCIVTREPG